MDVGGLTFGTFEERLEAAAYHMSYPIRVGLMPLEYWLCPPHEWAKRGDRG